MISFQSSVEIGLHRLLGGRFRRCRPVLRGRGFRAGFRCNYLVVFELQLYDLVIRHELRLDCGRRLCCVFRANGDWFGCADNRGSLGDGRNIGYRRRYLRLRRCRLIGDDNRFLGCLRCRLRGHTGQQFLQLNIGKIENTAGVVAAFA